MIEEHITDKPTIPPELEPLAEEARKYDDFQKFSDDYSFRQMRGRYWHITEDPHFKLKKEYAPRDLSSLSMSFTGIEPGLMVSYTPDVWSEYFPGRKYAVEVRFPEAKKSKDYTIVERGFGHEIFIRNLDKVEVGEIIPIEEAIREEEQYNKIIPQSKEKLKSFWEVAKKASPKRIEEHII